MKNRIAFAFIMSLITTAIISFTLIAVNVGLQEGFLAIWLRSWAVSYVLAVLAIIFIGPRVQMLVDYLLKKKIFSNVQ